ncbi:MAG: SDR family NAD(P)-dependent oxidoreductase [Microthrixaceae bacterium]
MAAWVVPTPSSSRAAGHVSWSTTSAVPWTVTAGATARPRRSWTRSPRPAARRWRTTTRSPRPKAARPSCRAPSTFDTVDIVINNAGILRDKTFHNMTPDLVEPVIAVHLLGAFYVTQPAWTVMRDKGYGRVINTSSNSGLLGNFGQANYGAAKLGLVGFTRVLANEGKAKGIKVNAIAPVAKTRMTEDLLGPMGDKLEPGEVTPTVIYLAHEDCPVNGEVYSVAGGVVARYFIGLTKGWYSEGHTPEDVRDHFEEIRDETGYIVPEDPSGELKKLLETLQ